STQISIAVNKILDAFSPKALYSQKQNDFFLGALGVAIIGGITTSAYYILNRLWNYLINKFIVSITINNNEEAFEWIVNYLGKRVDLFITAQKLAVYITRNKHTRSRRSQKNKDDDKPQIEFVPGTGLHVFKYKKRLIWMYRHRSQEIATTGKLD